MRVTAAGTGIPDLGANASLNGKQIFPANNPWNQRVDGAPVDSNSSLIISRFSSAMVRPDFGANLNGSPFGIPYVVVSGTQAKVAIGPILYADESDPGPYPIPADAPIENGSDHHILALDRDNWVLYELFNASKNADNSWRADSAAKFDLNANTLRPAGWTSADAAGLPILPGLVRYDEVHVRHAINHAIRFTLQNANTAKAYVHPGTHYASNLTGPSYMPMGGRMRLKASFDISGFSADNQVILQAMKTYGLILADNGNNMFISGAPDTRWNDNELNQLKNIPATAFEVVQLGYASEPSSGSSATPTPTPTPTASATPTPTPSPTVQGTPCSGIDQSYPLPIGFGSPMNFFTNPVSRMVGAVCDSGTVTASITKAASIQSLYTYMTGYQWNTATKQWTPVSYQCDGTVISNAWCNGNAHATLNAGSPYFIAYACTLVNNVWKCGCRDQQCSQKFWQLQKMQL